MSGNNSTTINRMTEGTIWKAILYFSLPMLLSNLFQQLYNTVDSIIVGNFVGAEALAAVGSSGSIIYLITGFFIGLAAGAGVVVAQEYGAKNKEATKEAIHTSLGIGIVFGVIITAIGIISTDFILKMMGVPESVFDESSVYLKIYFTGMLSTMIYNMGASIIQATGDSKSPLYILMTASVTNIILDVVFVKYMSMGIEGAALATIISQTLSAVLVILKIRKSHDKYEFRFRNIRIHMKTLGRIFAIGLPGGIQNTAVSMSNIVVQSHINSFGAIAMAGCSAYQKIEGFAVLSTTSFSMAMATFAGQNTGAGKHDRVRKGIITGTLMSVTSMAIVSVVLYATVSDLIAVFNNDSGVVYYGVRMMSFLVPGYLFVSASDAIAGSLRGMGKSVVPMAVIISCWCGLRMVWIAASTRVYHDIAAVFLGYPISWTASFIILVIYLKRTAFKKEIN